MGNRDSILLSRSSLSPATRQCVKHTHAHAHTHTALPQYSRPTAAVRTCDGLAAHVLPHKAQHRALCLWDVVDVPRVCRVRAQHTQLAGAAVTHGHAVAGVVLVTGTNRLSQLLHTAKALLVLLLAAVVGALEQAGGLALSKLLWCMATAGRPTGGRQAGTRSAQLLLALNNTHNRTQASNRAGPALSKAQSAHELHSQVCDRTTAQLTLIVGKALQ